MPDNFDIFLSHSTASSNLSQALADELRANGFTVFYDRDSLAHGAAIEDQIRQGLQSSRAIVVVVDSSSSGSPWTAFEVGAALGMGKKVVPVITSEVGLDELPAPLRKIQSIRAESAAGAAAQIGALVQKSDGF